MGNQCTKFEVFSITRYTDILGGTINSKLVTWCDHDPFRDGLLSVGWDLLWLTCLPMLKSKSLSLLT